MPKPGERASKPGEPAALHFLAIGDWGEQTPMTAETAEAMARYAREVAQPAFVLSLGDNFYPRGVRDVEDSQWRSAWEAVFLKHPELRVPWCACLGNHDYEGNPEAQVEMTRSERNPCGGLWYMPAREYAFSAPVPGGGMLQCFALDTNGCQYSVRRRAPETEHTLHESIAKLQEALAAAPRDSWKIVFGHHPLVTGGRGHGVEARCLRQREYSVWHGLERRRLPGYNLEAALAAGGCDAYFSGHEHVFQSARVSGVDTFVCGASGVYLGYCHGKDAHGDQLEWADDRSQKGPRHGFVAVRVTPDVLTVDFISARSGLTLHQVQRRRRGGEGRATAA